MEEAAGGEASKHAHTASERASKRGGIGADWGEDDGRRRESNQNAAAMKRNEVTWKGEKKKLCACARESERESKVVKGKLNERER